ncbi:MAG: Ntn hydrolase family protein [Desulfobaccales bacterium]
MTQALAGFNTHGLFLAADSRATRFDAGGRAQFFNVPKLFPLGRNCAILSGGAGVSVPLSLALQREIERRRGLADLEEITEFATAFLSRGYAIHLEKHGPEPEGFRHLYFILAGYSPEKPSPGFQLLLLGSEENELPLRPAPVSNLVVMPRNLGMEMRLFKALSAGLALDQLLAMSREFLEKQAQLKEEVGPPYYYATITAEGYRTTTI